MENTEKFEAEFSQARRDESKAHNEMDYYERVAKGQQEQMDALLQHKAQCVKGIIKAKETGLLAIHVREFKLLMSHINLTMESLSYKVDKSQTDYEKSKEIWSEKSETFNSIKEEIKQRELDKLALEESNEKELLEAEKEGKFGLYKGNNKEANQKGKFGYTSLK